MQMIQKNFLTKLISLQKTGEEHIDIITFYNEVFIPAIKPLLAEVVSGANPNKKDEEKGSVGGMRSHKKLSDIFLLLNL
jgi:hypothetical protein